MIHIAESPTKKVLGLAVNRSNIPAGLYDEMELIPGIRIVGSYFVFPMEPRVLELLMHYKLEADEEIMIWYSNIRSVEDSIVSHKVLEDISIEHDKADKLFPYQRVAAYFANKVGRYILADETGLGKTASAIVSVDISPDNKYTLVICPKSLIYWWEDEIRSWSNQGKPIHIIDRDRYKEQLNELKHTGGWYIANWEFFRSNHLEFTKVRWDWLLADESHRAKNRKTLSFKALKSIWSKRTILITGTPFSNRPDEVWTLLHKLYPKDYPSFWRFSHMFVQYDPYTLRPTRQPKHSNILANHLRYTMMRRTKEECQDQIPDKIYRTVRCSMHKEQAIAYSTLANNMVLELDGMHNIPVYNILSLYLRFQQIVSGLSTLSDKDISAKLDASEDLIEDCSNKIVVFSRFRNTVNSLCNRLERRGIEHIQLMGGDNVHGVVDQFQRDPDIKVLVATLATGGEGITLTSASNMIFVEKHWNPAIQKQAEDRIHRIGQKNVCSINFLFCPQTVDQLIEDVVDEKKNMSREVLAEVINSHAKMWSDPGFKYQTVSRLSG